MNNQTPSARTIRASLARLGAGLVCALLAISLATSVAQADTEAAESDPAVLMQQVGSASDQQAAFDGLTPAQRGLIQKEIDESTTQVTEIQDDTAVSARAYTGCYRRTEKAAKVGGVTHKIMYQVVQSTKVCAKKGKVTKVTMPQKYQKTGYVLWRNGGLTTSKRNAGYEGRGVARGTFIFGVKGVDVKRATICAQLRMNANGYSVVGSFKCAV